MTSSYTPFGLRPVRKRGSAPNSAGLSKYKINPAGYATAIYKGDPVGISSGYLFRCSAAADHAVGVFMGCQYNDINTKKPTWSPNYVANTSVGTDPAGIVAMVADDPDNTYVIQADASVTVGDVGLNFALTIGTGSNITGQSAFGLDAGTRGNTGLFRVVDIYDTPDNAFGDAYPIVEVQIHQHYFEKTSAA
jgi:hypothetical protein